MMILASLRKVYFCQQLVHERGEWRGPMTEPPWVPEGLFDKTVGLYGYGPRLGENVELALEYRERLGLTQEQVLALEELQIGILGEVAPLRMEIEELRAQIISGEFDRVDGILALQDLRAALDDAAAPYRAGVTSILTVQQHTALQGILWSTRPGAEASWDLWSGGGPGTEPGFAYGGRVGVGFYGRRGAGPGWGGRAWAGRGPGARAGFHRGRGAGMGLRWWRRDR
jgi:hypothetical protein